MFSSLESPSKLFGGGCGCLVIAIALVAALIYGITRLPPVGEQRENQTEQREEKRPWQH